MNKPKLKPLIALAAAVSMAFAPAAFARGHHGGWHGGYHGGYHGHYRHYRGYGYHDHFGRWLAGAAVAGAVTGLVIDATAPRSYYYDDAPTVVYRRSPTVVYEDAPPVVVEHRVVETTRVYDDHDTRYIRDDGWSAQR